METHHLKPSSTRVLGPQDNAEQHVQYLVKTLSDGQSQTDDVNGTRDGNRP
jgi:hypothetical protein